VTSVRPADSKLAIAAPAGANSFGLTARCKHEVGKLKLISTRAGRAPVIKVRALALDDVRVFGRGFHLLVGACRRGCTTGEYVVEAVLEPSTGRERALTLLRWALREAVERGALGASQALRLVYTLIHTNEEKY
jgi:hypothetical protein